VLSKKMALPFLAEKSIEKHCAAPIPCGLLKLESGFLKLESGFLKLESKEDFWGWKAALPPSTPKSLLEKP
jgi:hypothetical protein